MEYYISLLDDTIKNNVSFMVEEPSINITLDIFENTKSADLNINKVSDIIYRQYLQIKKILVQNENNIMFINTLILFKIADCSKNNEAYKEKIQEFTNQKYNILLNKYDKVFVINHIKELAIKLSIEINDDIVDKIVSFINQMNLGLIVNNYSVKMNKILGQVFEKIITKKEIGAYYTNENTTKYITENCIIPSLILEWANLETSLFNYLEDYKNENKISLVEYSIKQNILLKNVIFKLIEKFDTSLLLKSIHQIKIIDISCGSGSFIFSSYYLLKEILQKIDFKNNINNYSEIFENNIFGIDIDIDAVNILKFRIFIEKLFEEKMVNSDYTRLTDNFIIANSLLYNKSHEKKTSLFEVDNNNEEPIFESNDKLKYIIKNGGFDVVLGNPPYLEYKNILSYKIENYKSEKCNNLYAFMLEKNFDILKENGHMGVIIPISYISTKRMKPIRKYLIENSQYQFCSNYADRPSCLFNGVHQKLNIVLLEKKTLQNNKKVYTTNYLHWYSENKNNIYDVISYQENKFETEDFLFKIGNEIEENIIKKLCFNNNKSLSENIGFNKDYAVWVNMRMTFWNKSFVNPQKSNEYKVFYFDSKENAVLFSLLLNSNIFFFYWECISDVWHITLKDLSHIKIDFNDFDNIQKQKMLILYQQLEDNLELNKREINTKQTEFEYQHKKDKKLIDKIDLLFKDYFIFTDGEIEYIKNYQLKFRLNGELSNYLNEI